MNKHQTGSTHVVIIVVLVLALLTALGWVFWQNFMQKEKGNSSVENTQQDNNEPALKEYKASTTVPDDWKRYDNNKYKFSISYPANWKISESDGELGDNSAAANKSFFSLGFLPYTTEPMVVQHSLYVTHETMAEAVATRKQNSNGEKDPDEAVRSTITKEERFTYDGHEAVRFDMTSEDGMPPDGYSSDIYISANNLLYKFGTGFYDSKALRLNDKDVLTIFESLKIKS